MKPRHKKLLTLLLCCLLTAAVLLPLLWYASASESQETVAILPLDSRPCNTQYPQLLGQMAGMTVRLPDQALLDDFLTPSQPDPLWRWLEDTASDADRLIIFTNQLFNGGLIHSRDSGSYANISQQLDRLADFCRAHHEKDITVVTILPRLKPSQFDQTLWPYEEALTQWGQARDQAQALNQPLPAPPAAVPEAVQAQYLSLYDNSAQLTNQLAAMAQEGLIQQLVVGQDDASQWGPSNGIFRALAAKAQDNLRLVHGADELTMLLLAACVDEAPRAVRILYSDPQLADSFFPYEGASLDAILTEKCQLAGLTIDSSAADTIYIHTSPASGQATLDWLSNLPPKGYLGLADIAYTNRGDSQLAQTLLSQPVFGRLDCYSGWNTAGNALGTVIAHCRLSQALEADTWGPLYRGSEEALSAALAFKAVRYAEDLIFQGLLSSQLREDFMAWAVIDYTTAFAPGRQAEAQDILKQRFAPYGQQLQQLLQAPNTLAAGRHQTAAATADFTVYFPWARAFEIRADWTVSITN